jgi:hypothetical protein
MLAICGVVVVPVHNNDDDKSFVGRLVEGRSSHDGMGCDNIVASFATYRNISSNADSIIMPNQWPLPFGYKLKDRRGVLVLKTQS